MNWYRFASFQEMVSHIEETGRIFPIFYEGCRGSGKTHTAKKTAEILNGIYYKTTAIFQPIIADPINGIAFENEAQLDLTQACIYVMDFIRQANFNDQLPVILDRSYVSSCVFNGTNEERLKLFADMVKELGGAFVLMTFDQKVIRERLKSRNLYDQSREEELVRDVLTEYIKMKNILSSGLFGNVYELKCDWRE